MMPSISFEPMRPLLIGTLIIVVLVAIAIGASFLSKKNVDEISSPKEQLESLTAPGDSNLTDDEKRAILESLTVPGDSNLTDDEKRAILESTTVPGDSNLTDDEKRAILESLTAPQ